MKRYTKEKNNMEKQTNGLGIAIFKLANGMPTL